MRTSAAAMAALLALAALACGAAAVRNAPTMMELEAQVWMHERDCPRLCDASCMCAEPSMPACHANCEKCLFAGVPCGSRLQQHRQEMKQQNARLNPRFVEVAHAARAAKAPPAAEKNFEALVNNLKHQKQQHDATAAAPKASEGSAKEQQQQPQQPQQQAAPQQQAKPQQQAGAGMDQLAEAAEVAQEKAQTDAEKAKVEQEEKKVEQEEEKVKEEEKKVEQEEEHAKEEEKKAEEERDEAKKDEAKPSNELAAERARDHEHLLKLDERLARVVELQEELLKAVHGHPAFGARMHEATGLHPSPAELQHQHDQESLHRVVDHLEHLAAWVRQREHGEADWASPDHVEEILAKAVDLAEAHHHAEEASPRA